MEARWRIGATSLFIVVIVDAMVENSENDKVGGTKVLEQYERLSSHPAGGIRPSQPSQLVPSISH
jgi:hypothetical protein